MPKLQRITEAQPVSNQRFVNREGRREAAADAPLNKAITQTGSAMAEVGARLRTAQLETELARAQIRAADRLDRAYREIEANTDIEPDAVEAEFSARASAILSEEGGRIQAPAFQRAWKIQAEEMASDGAIQARTLGVRRQTDRVRANVLEVGAEYKRLSEDPATDLETLERSGTTYRQLIERQRRAGVFDEEGATALLLEVDETASAGQSMRHILNVERLLEEGRYGEAETYFKGHDHEIAPAQRLEVERAIELKSREARRVETSDQLWTASGGDFERAMAAAREIEDVEDRLAVEERLGLMREQDRAAELEAEREADTTLTQHILSGGTLANAPPGALGRATGSTLRSINGMIRSRDNAQTGSHALTSTQSKSIMGLVEADLASNPELFTAGVGQWEAYAPETAALFQMLRPEHQNELMSKVMERQQSGQSVDTAESVFKTLVEQVQFHLPDRASPRRFSDVAREESGRTRHSRAEREVRAELWQLSRRHAEATGSDEVSVEDARKMIAIAFKNHNERKYGDAYEALMEEEAATQQVAEQEALVNEARSIARERLGRDPNAAELAQIVWQLVSEE